MSRFVHLHVHTEYSFFNSTIRTEKLIEKTLSLNMDSVAITDHGNVCALPDFYHISKKNGIKPILGYEAYIDPVIHNTDFEHLILLSATAEGYRNLLSLSELAFKTRRNGKPFLSMNQLQQKIRGLIVLSGCKKGRITRLLASGRKEKAKIYAQKLLDSAGPAMFYLEISCHGIPGEAEINSAIIGLANELGIPLVATNDCHYLEPSEAALHDRLLSLKDQCPIDDPQRKRFPSNEFYFKTQQEMNRLFRGIPGAVTNTGLIADLCETDIIQSELFSSAEVYEHNLLLLQMCNDILASRQESTPKLTERLNRELKLIIEKGLAYSFILLKKMADIGADKNRNFIFSHFCWAAGTLTACCVGLTPWDLLREEDLAALEKGIDCNGCSFSFDVAYMPASLVNQIFSETFGSQSYHIAGQVIRINDDEDALSGQIIGMKYPDDFDITVLASLSFGILDFCPTMRMDEVVRPFGQFSDDSSLPKNILRIRLREIEGHRTLQMAEQLIKENYDSGFNLKSIPLDDYDTYRLFQQGQTKFIANFDHRWFSSRDKVKTDLIVASISNYENLVRFYTLHKPWNYTDEASSALLVERIEIAYKSAYLKVHYPAAYFSALLCINGISENLIEECKNCGISFTPAQNDWINISYKPNGRNRIAFGLKALANEEILKKAYCLP